MHRASRASTLAILAFASIAAFGACRRRPAPEVQPVATDTAPPPPACDAACLERQRQDSIRLANEARDRADAARRSAIEAARSSLLATIYFDYDASEITDDARAKLDAKVPVLSQNAAVRIRISGHTDSRGSDEYNLALGQRRAAAAKRYLTDRGIDAGRIEIVSFGEERGACTDETESCWSQNRRDEFEITGGEISAVQTSSTSR
jgi:peptidoglycan-associated lipoprotein